MKSDVELAVPGALRRHRPALPVGEVASRPRTALFYSWILQHVDHPAEL